MRTSDGHGPAGSAGLVELDQSECMRLLAEQYVGRVVYSRDAVPGTVVRYRLMGGSIVLLASADSDLARVVPGSVVAFEADALHRAAGTGWGVVVTGVAQAVREPSALAWLDALRLTSWAGDDRPTVLQIEPGLVTGVQVVGTATEDGA